MDALVYEDTPLATYFEGEAIPYELPHEQSPPSPPPFAPRGLPDLKHRLRKIRRSATSIAPGSAYNEELLEKLRYIVVASQLLSDEAGPRPSLADHEILGDGITTLRGAAITATASFLAAWAIQRLQNRKQTPRALSWIDLGLYCAGIILAAIIGALLGRRLYTNYLQRASVRTLSKYVQDSHNLDTTANNVIRFIQEVEVVSRGYELGSLLPPITRLEDRQTIKRCQTLRRELAAALKTLIIVMVESHNAVQQYINNTDVQRYYDVYEVSLVEYSQAAELVDQEGAEQQESLKDLRFYIRLHSLARKVFLCDLLALQQATGWSRLHQWNDTLYILRGAEAITTSKASMLSSCLAEEEWGNSGAVRTASIASSQSENATFNGNHTIKMQLRHFDDVAFAIRGLNAKMHMLKEEISGLTNANSEDAVIASALSKHYDSIGIELRNVLSDWERGKSSMLLPLETDQARTSCSSSSIRTPISSSPSLGDIQIVDGGPVDAFRLLTGDSPSSGNIKGMFDEEVFEAVASRTPRKRMSVSGMSREEKMAKLAEDRRKRATLQEQAETTTNMLRELQMVIKHRPKPSLPYNTLPNTGSHRIATL